MLSRLLLVGAAVCGAAVVEKNVHHVTHDGHIDGFTLDHVWVMEKGEVVKYNLGKGRVAGVQEFEAFDPDQRSAARTRSLAKLAMAGAYTGMRDGLMGDEEDVRAIVEAGDGLYNTTSFEAETAEFNRVFDALLKEITDAVAAGSTFAPLDTPSSLVAFGFTSPNNVHALVFRGARGLLDRIDVSAITTPYLTSGRAKTKAREAWITDAGLSWGTNQSLNYARSAAEDRAILHEQGKIAIMGLFGSLDATLVPAGVAPIVQQIALEWVAVVRSISGAKAAITGHSLGGTRAAFAAMTIKEHANYVVQTVTFGSLGAACWPRGNYFGMTFLNATSDMSSIVEYSHPLDTYGNLMGRDVGRTCWVGKADIENSKAKKYCEPIMALDPAYYMRVEAAVSVQNYVVQTRAGIEYGLAQANAAGNAAMVAAITAQSVQFEYLISTMPGFMKWINATEMADYHHHEKCRYFTHNPVALYKLIDAELRSNGDTNSGCVYNKAVPHGDVQCPYNYPTPQEGDDDFWTGKPGGPVFGVFIGLTFIALIVAVVLCGTGIGDTVSEPDVDPSRDEAVEEMEEKSVQDE